MLTKEYIDNRAPAAPPDVPSVYESDDQVVLHWEEDGQTPTIRKVTPWWASDTAEHLLQAADEADNIPERRQFSLTFNLGLSVDCVGGAITLMSDRRVSYIQLGHDDIDLMIAELQAVKRRSLEIRRDPVRDAYPYIRQNLHNDFEPCVVCTAEHPEGLEVDDSLLDPKLAKALEKFIAQTDKNEAALETRQEPVPVGT